MPFHSPGTGVDAHPVEALVVQAVDGPLDERPSWPPVWFFSELSSTSSHQATEVLTPAAWALAKASSAVLKPKLQAGWEPVKAQAGSPRRGVDPVGQVDVEVEPASGPRRLGGQAAVDRPLGLAHHLDHADGVGGGREARRRARALVVGDVVAVGARRVGRAGEAAGAGGLGHAHDGPVEHLGGRAPVGGVAVGGHRPVVVGEPVAPAVRGPVMATMGRLWGTPPSEP